MDETKFPTGWDADRVQRVLSHYEGQTGDEAGAEDEAGIGSTGRDASHSVPEWDAFISHASEDKESFVEPLVNELRRYGLNIWFDKFTLRVGSSLRESIDNGLANSRFGIVVLSHAFFAKNWPQKELNALFSRQVNGHDVILPVWHQLTKEDILRYSPLLSDLLAANSADGFSAVARALVQVIRPTAFNFETSSTDARNAGSRMREKLKERFPHLDCRVTLGVSAPDPFGAMAKPDEPGVIASGFHDSTRVELFTTDHEAYNRAPLSFTVQMTEDGFRKLQEAQRLGKRVELGPEEIAGFSSELFQFLMPSSGISQSRLILSPVAPRRKFRFKLTFALEEEREEFQYVEFGLLKATNEEVVVRSSAPPMPLELILTFSLVGESSSFSASYSYVGHEIRKIYKAHRALQFLMGGGTLEITDLESDQTWPLIRCERRISLSTEADKSADRLLENLYEIAVAFNEKVTWVPSKGTEDALHIELLQEIVRTGQVLIPADKVTMTIDPSPGVKIEDVLKEQAVLCIRPNTAPDFATVCGKTFDVGPYSIFIQPRQIEVLGPNHDPVSRIVRIDLAQPLLYEFDKFRRDNTLQRAETLAEQPQ